MYTQAKSYLKYDKIEKNSKWYCNIKTLLKIKIISTAFKRYVILNINQKLKLKIFVKIGQNINKTKNISKIHIKWQKSKISIN